MNKQKLIEKLLEKLDEQDLLELLGETVEKEDPEQGHVHTISGNKRRGSGYSKKNNQQPNKNKKRKTQGRIPKGKACRVLPMDIVENRPNKFEDFIEKVSLDATEKQELDEAKKNDEQTRKVQTRFKKQSRGNNLVDVECCVCGEEQMVSASIVHDARRWKCNECSTQPGY